MSLRLRLDVHIELICPWCWIGLRQLQQARRMLLARHPDVALEPHWHLQTLLPDLPEAGLPFREFYIRRLGSWPAVQARQAQVRAAGRGVDLDFDFDAIERMPNTALAHGLLRDARGQLDDDAFEALLERLFAAHFQLGENLGDPELLASLAEAFGVQPSVALPAVEPELPAVPGVPYFVFKREYALSGAQSAEHLLAALLSQARPAPAPLG